MPNDKDDAVQFTGCDLHYHCEYPAFDRNPSTLKSETPRPVSVNGKRMAVIDMHAHCQLSNVWPMVQGREDLGGENPYEGRTLTMIVKITADEAECLVRAARHVRSPYCGPEL